MVAPIDAAAAHAYNQSIITLAASMGVEPDLIFNPMRELRACLIEVHEHVITFDSTPSPAPPHLHGPDDEVSSCWVKVSSADELWNCCAAAPHYRNYDRLLHVHLLPSTPIDDVNKIDDWEDEDCSNIRIYVMNRVQTICKIDALACLGSIRDTILKTKDKIEHESTSLYLLANEQRKDVDRLQKSQVAYVAVRDSKGPVCKDLLNTVRDEAIITSRSLVVAKVSNVTLTHAADATKRLVDSLNSKVLQIDNILKSLTLMGCGHPDDDFQEPPVLHEEDEGNQEQE